MLKDHADPGSHRLGARRESNALSIDFDRAFVRLENAVEHVHERAFSRTVLADERVDFACPHVEVDTVIGEDVAKPFCDALTAQHGRRQRGVHFKAAGGTSRKFWSS